MIDEKINQIYLKKIKLFQKYNKHYYDLNKPLVEDHIFDNLKLEIFDLEKKYNFLNHKNSPKNSIGFKPSKIFKKVKHKTPMLSLGNAFDRDDLLNFEGLNPQMLEVLVKDNIKSLKEFATCADWELAGGYKTVDGKRVKDEGLLEHFDLSLSEAQQLIMKARETLGWVTKEESDEIIKSLDK